LSEAEEKKALSEAKEIKNTGDSSFRKEQFEQAIQTYISGLLLIDKSALSSKEAVNLKRDILSNMSKA